MTLDLNKKNKYKNKILINIALFFAFTLFVVYFLLLPATNKIKKLRVDIANAKIEINNAIEKEKNINNQTDKLKTIESQIEKLDKIFISRNRELEFITTLEGVASKNNIEQTFDLKAIPDFNDDDFINIPIIIKAKGEFNNVMNYLKDLETLAYYINISNLEITKNTSGGQAVFSKNNYSNEQSNSIITMNITANTYFK